MPTRDERTIKSTGGYYSSLSDFAEDARDLVTPDITAVAKVYSFSDTSPVVFPPEWNTDLEHRIEIITPLSERYRPGVGWDNNAYRLEITPTSLIQSAIDFGAQFVNLIGIQISIDITTEYNNVYALDNDNNSNANLEISDNIIKAVGIARDDYRARGMSLHNVAGNVTKIKNNIVWGFKNGNTTDDCIGIECREDGGSLIWYVFHNTVVDSDVGYGAVAGGTIVAKNNIAALCTDGYFSFFGSFDAASTNNCSDIGDAPGSNPVNGSPVFVNAPGKNFRLSHIDNVAQSQGINLSSDSILPVLYDLDGNLRVGAYDIGAHQVTSPSKWRELKPVEENWDKTKPVDSDWTKKKNSSGIWTKEKNSSSEDWVEKKNAITDDWVKLN